MSEDLKPEVNYIPAPPLETNILPAPNGTVMRGGSMQSPNFVTGTKGAGWKIGGDGKAEFQDITARGKVTADTLNIGGITEITVTTDDDLQTALNNINTTGGGSLRLSPGTYTITADLTVYDNTRIIGDTSNNTTLDFDSGAFSIIYLGTDIYTTGTLSVNSASTAVTGVGTTWTSAMIGRQIFISNRWYVIANVGSTTSITLATAFADANVAGVTYRIANPINNVLIEGVTIKNSATTALEGTDIRDVTLKDVVFLSNNKGFVFTNFMSVLISSTTIVASTSNGFEASNGSFMNVISGIASVSNGGSGAVLNNIKSCPFLYSASNSNTVDGYNLTDVTSCLFKVECSSNGGQGIEMVSGCDNNFINDSLISNNTSDGIKLTATSDNNTIGVSVNVTSNGGYGINIAASTCNTNRVLYPFYSGNTSGTLSDSGTGTVTAP